jgi:hypothetical protein
MPVLYTSFASPIVSRRWSDVQELLNQLQDNNANLIFAEDVRDAVYTLWERVEEVAIVAASASLASPYFQNPNPTTIEVGGIAEGTTFSSPQTMQQMFDALLYPYTAPILSLSGLFGQPLANKEYGQSLNSTLLWSVTKKSNTITSINVNSQIILPVNGGDQSGTMGVTGTWSTPAVSTLNTFTMSVSDGTNTTSTSTSYEWMNKIYWGRLDLTSILNPDLSDPNTRNSRIATIVSNFFPNSSSGSLLIRGLTGAGVSPGNLLAKVKNKSYPNINGAGGYLLFAWPSSVPNAITPAFSVNGLTSTGFSPLLTGFSFINTHGITTNYEVWISHTAQNSPLNPVTIS